MGFVRVKRQGVGGLLLHNMYRSLAEDHFKAVDRIKKIKPKLRKKISMINLPPIKESEVPAEVHKDKLNEVILT